jgi:hypothetical protein
MREMYSADRHLWIPSREQIQEEKVRRISDRERDRTGEGQREREQERGGREIGRDHDRFCERSPGLTAQPPRGSGRNPTPSPITYPPSWPAAPRPLRLLPSPRLRPVLQSAAAANTAVISGDREKASERERTGGSESVFESDNWQS